MSFPQINSALSSLFYLFLMIALSYFSSLVIWQIIAPDPSHPLSIKLPTIKEQEESSFGNVFRNYQLFGPPPVKVKKPKKVVRRIVVKAIVPKVKLKLKGILSGVNNYAIIQIGREQEVYGEGDRLSYLYVKEIGADYVVFDDNGILYTVYVSDESVEVGGEPSESQKKAAKQRKLNPSSNSSASIDKNSIPSHVPVLNEKEIEKFQNFKQIMRKNPLQMMGKVNASPYREGGKLVGYQITPGSELALFRKVGLRAGDIVVDVNGTKLNQVNNFTEGMQLMERLGKAKTLDLLIVRRGQKERIFLDLNR